MDFAVMRAVADDLADVVDGVGVLQMPTRLRFNQGIQVDYRAGVEERALIVAIAGVERTADHEAQIVDTGSLTFPSQSSGS